MRVHTHNYVSRKGPGESFNSKCGHKKKKGGGVNYGFLRTSIFFSGIIAVNDPQLCYTDLLRVAPHYKLVLINYLLLKKIDHISFSNS